MTAKRIMLCTYSAGYGHRKAAEALKDAFSRINPEAGVYIIDPFEIGRPKLNAFIIFCYLQILKWIPSLYRFMYEKAEASNSGNSLGFWWRIIINRKFRQALHKIMQSEQPDVILCLHPFSAIAVYMWRNTVDRCKPAVIGLLTDYTIHPYWLKVDLDGYFVGSPDLIGEMTKHGIPRRQVWPVGIPVDSTVGTYRDKSAIRRSLGLNPDRPIVLIMGGGLGLGGLDDIVGCLGSMGQEIQILVVTGANPAVQESLTRLVAGMVTAVKVFGFINNVPELMAASDLIVTKPGGVTVAEALATGLPIIIWKPIPGQEVRNTSFLVENDLAVQVEDLQELVPMVRHALLGKHDARLELSLANQSAARNIADVMINNFIR